MASVVVIIQFAVKMTTTHQGVRRFFHKFSDEICSEICQIGIIYIWKYSAKTQQNSLQGLTDNTHFKVMQGSHLQFSAADALMIFGKHWKCLILGNRRLPHIKPIHPSAICFMQLAGRDEMNSLR